jgi:hypothetical protein
MATDLTYRYFGRPTAEGRRDQASLFDAEEKK